MKNAALLSALMMSCLCAAPALASDLLIRNAKGNEIARFSQDDIEALGTRHLTTTTPWTDEAVTFSGADGKAVLEAAGLKDTTVLAIALDDYAIEVDWTDFVEHNALIATRMDGERLVAGKRGPFWIVFDYDNAKAGIVADLRSKSVWHLVEFEIE